MFFFPRDTFGCPWQFWRPEKCHGQKFRDKKDFSILMTKKTESARDIFRECARQVRKIPVTISKKMPVTEIITDTLPVTKMSRGKKPCVSV